MNDPNAEMASYDKAIATRLTWLDDGGIDVLWDDGHHSVFSRAYLRAMCPCATCQGTHGPPTTLVDARAIGVEAEPAKKKKFGGFNVMTGPKPPSKDVAIQIAGAEPVGRYGMKLVWGDGHDTGIYTWRYLRMVSPGDGTEASPATHAAKHARPEAKQAAGI